MAFAVPGRGRLDCVRTLTVRFAAAHLSRPSASFPIVRLDVTTGVAAVAVILNEDSAIVIFGPAFVLIDLTGDSNDALPQRFTACTAT